MNSDIILRENEFRKYGKGTVKPSGKQRLRVRIIDEQGLTVTSSCVYARTPKAAIEVLNRVKALMAELDGMVVE